MNLEDYIGQRIEFQPAGFLEGDRLVGYVDRVIKRNDGTQVAIVDVDGQTYGVTEDIITGTGAWD